MRKIIQLLLLGIILLSSQFLSAQYCTSSGSWSGSDGTAGAGSPGPAYDALYVDLSCASSPITDVDLTVTFTETFCPSWYTYNLVVNGVTQLSYVCSAEINGFDLAPLAPISSVLFQVQDMDSYPSDFVSMSYSATIYCDDCIIPPPPPGACEASLLWAPSEYDSDPAFRAQIAAITNGPVDYYNAATGTPTLAELQQYDVVATWANYSYANNVAFGDVLAQYVDGGGKVILGQWTNSTAGNYLSGAIMTPAYSPAGASGASYFGSNSYNGDGVSDLFDNVFSLSSPFMDVTFIQGTGIADGTTSIGGLMAAYQPDYEVISLAGMINAVSFGSAGEWAQLVANAVCISAVPYVPPVCFLDCPGDMEIYLDPGDCVWNAEYNARTENCDEGILFTEIQELPGPFVPEVIQGFVDPFDPSTFQEWLPQQLPYPGFGTTVTWLNNGPSETLGDGSAFDFSQLPGEFAMSSGGSCAGDAYWADTYTNFIAPYAGTLTFDWELDLEGTDPFWINFGVHTNGWVQWYGDNLNDWFWGGPGNETGTVTIPYVGAGANVMLGIYNDDYDCSSTVYITNWTFTQLAPPHVPLEGIYVTDGPVVGEEIGVGETECVTLGLFFNDIKVDSCTFCIEVFDYPNPISAIACNDHVQISLDQNCEAEVTADMILEGGPYSCYDNYEVVIEGIQGNVLYGPGTYVVGVYDEDGNNCWSTITVLDKIPPVVICEDIVVPCYDPIPYVAPEVIDNCDNWSLSFVDLVNDMDCNTEFQTIIYRTWTVTDHNNGMTDDCVQTIYVTRPDLGDLGVPPNFDGLTSIGNEEMLECSGDWPRLPNGHPAPLYLEDGGTGGPTGIGYVPGSSEGLCGTIEIFFTDVVYHIGCGQKILREWTIIDDCTAQIVTHTQIIRITDTTAPTFMLPEDMVANTKGYVCNADFDIPAIMHLEDNCDPAPRWYATTTAGFIVGDKNLNGYVDANEQWRVLGVGLGQYELCYTAVDWCGNFLTECITLYVQDLVPPIPVCEQYKQVSLTPLGDARVFAEDFDSGSFDNCGPVWFKVLRGFEYNNQNQLLYDGGCPELNGDDNPTTSANDVWFDDDVFFCCEDLEAPVMVTLRVFDRDPGFGPVNPSRMYSPNGDLFGRFNDCWTVVDIECKIPPMIIAPDLTVSCEANLDPYVNTALMPEVVSVCGFDISYTDTDKKGDVCTGYIDRTWTVVGCGKTVVDQQRISFTATEPFDPCTISFPADQTNILCPNDTGNPGYPTWDENPCNIVTAEIVNIDTFTYVDGACYKIIVDWAVVDWCVYEPNTGAEDNVDEVRNRKLVCNELVEDGYYRYTQILMVTDIYAPEIAVEDQCVATTNGCYAENVTMEAFATDSCNVDQKFWWKYIVINMDTWETVQYSYNYTPVPAGGRKGTRSKDNLDKTANGKIAILDPLPLGNYRVEWTVGDGCGNATSTFQYFTVADKKAPTPFLVDISTALMSNGMVEMTARFFDKGACNDQCLASFDQCSDVLYFTFTPILPIITNPQWLDQYGLWYFDPATGQQFNATTGRTKYLAGDAHSWDPALNTAGKVFLCEDAPAVNVDVYVWDQFALNEDCDDGNYDFATVLLNLNDDGDCDQNLVQVSGMVSANHSGEGIDNVNMMIDREGAIEFPKYANTNDGAYAFNVFAGDYTVSASKTDDYLNGVSTLDLILIQKHLLGLVPLNGDNLIAADANATGSVSAADLFALRELILGVKSELANNDSWVFVPGSQDVLANADMTVNFGGIKVGDVNGSAKANFNSTSIEGRTANSINLVVDEAAVEAGVVEVAFMAENFNHVYGAQFTMNVNGMSYAGVEAGAMSVTDNNFGLVREGVITMSWNNAEGTTVTDGTVLFTLKLQSKVSGTLSNLISVSSDVTAAEAYTTENLDINGINVSFRGAEEVVFELYQNEPNPFAESTVIGFNLPEASNYTLTVFDVTGKVVKVISAEGQKGYNSERLDRKDISTGVMYYQLESGEYTATKKMIIIE